MGPHLSAMERRIEELRGLKGECVGLPSGFLQLDRKTLGFENGDLVIVAARPSMGKTSFAMNIAEQVAVDADTPVAVFSMEMSGEQLIHRVVSSHARVDLQRIRSGVLDEADFERVATSTCLLREKPLFIDETGALTPMELRSRARRLVSRHGVRLVIVDYIQLMREPGQENRTNEVSEISRSLKAMAKELRVPVIALSQLNRSVEGRTDKRPRLADLRESGSIEQDADIVLMLYRDEVYDPDSKQRGMAEIIIAKQRKGPLGTVRLAWLGAHCKFDNLAQGDYT